LVVGRLFEELHACDAAIQHMKNHSSWRDSCGSWHRGRLMPNHPSCQNRTCPVFALFDLRGMLYCEGPTPRG
jgi:hypothetical protein